MAGIWSTRHKWRAIYETRIKAPGGLETKWTISKPDKLVNPATSTFSIIVVGTSLAGASRDTR